MSITTKREENSISSGSWQWLVAAEPPHNNAAGGAPLQQQQEQGYSRSSGTGDAGHALVVGMIGLVCVVSLAVVYWKFFYRYCTACDVGYSGVDLQRSGSRMAYLRRTLSARVAAGSRSDGGLAYSVIKTIPSFEFRQVIEEQAGGYRGSNPGPEGRGANPGPHPMKPQKESKPGWNPGPAASPPIDPACPSLRECPICLGSYHADDHVRLLPACRHCFHLPCIDTWLLSHASCPLCRSPIFPPPLPDIKSMSSFLHVMAPPLPHSSDFSVVSH